MYISSFQAGGQRLEAFCGGILTLTLQFVAHLGKSVQVPMVEPRDHFKTSQCVWRQVHLRHKYNYPVMWLASLPHMDTNGFFHGPWGPSTWFGLTHGAKRFGLFLGANRRRRGCGSMKDFPCANGTSYVGARFGIRQHTCYN